MTPATTIHVALPHALSGRMDDRVVSTAAPAATRSFRAFALTPCDPTDGSRHNTTVLSAHHAVTLSADRAQLQPWRSGLVPEWACWIRRPASVEPVARCCCRHRSNLQGPIRHGRSSASLDEDLHLRQDVPHDRPWCPAHEAGARARQSWLRIWSASTTPVAGPSEAVGPRTGAPSPLT